jgi:PAS domain S-box-containing protein
LLALFLVVGISISLLQSTLSEANEALKRSREQVELAAEAGRIGFSESQGGDQVFWTPEMERLFRLQPGSFERTIGDWVKRIHPEDREKFQQERARQIEQRVPDLKYEYRALLENGQIRWLEGRRRLIFSETGDLAGVVSANVDITDRHELEEALRTRSEELKRSNQELERFAYTVAHDLQAPLRAVETMMQLFLKRTRGELNAESANLLDLVVSSADRMRRLIQDMLELARVTHAAPARDTVDTGAVAQLAMQTITADAGGARIFIGELPTLVADERQLLRLFENLIGNAIKYRGGRQPEVHVDAELQDGQWVFSVSDNGIGIDPEYHDRIFEAFQRLHSSSKYPGSGIGLAVCRQIVQQHGGRIWVESTPGEGSTFRFTIPQGTSASLSADQPMARSESAAARNRAAAG